MTADETCILYAADSQEVNEGADTTAERLSLVHAASPELLVRAAPAVHAVLSQGSNRSESPVLVLHELSQTDDWLNEPADKKMKADIPVKKFSILTECNANISISEEKLGFSLPDLDETMDPGIMDFDLSTQKPSNLPALESTASTSKVSDVTILSDHFQTS